MSVDQVDINLCDLDVTIKYRPRYLCPSIKLISTSATPVAFEDGGEKVVSVDQVDINLCDHKSAPEDQQI